MVTIFAFDNSLSMSRTITNDRNSISKLDCAKECAENIIKFYFTDPKYDLTQTAILSFSSRVQLLSRFRQTKNLNELLAAVKQVSYADKQSHEVFLGYLKELVCEEWGNLQVIDVIVFTNSKLPVATMELLQSKDGGSVLPFPCRLHFLCFETTETMTEQGLESTFEGKILNSNCQFLVQPLVTSGVASKQATDAVMNTLNTYIHKHVATPHSVLALGKMTCRTSVFPIPYLPAGSDVSKTYARTAVSIKVCGFISCNDAGTPPCLSKHILVAAVPLQENTAAAAAGKNSENGVLITTLHEALMQENKVALVKLFPSLQAVDVEGATCYGFLHTGENDMQLMLSILTGETIPWLGDLERLGSEAQWENKSMQMPVFPVRDRTKSKCSYAMPTVSSWTRTTGLQADLQKLLRTAKKLPDKSPAFFKDLNRLRRAALTFGFVALIKGMISLLERERSHLSSASPALPHLTHAITQLDRSLAQPYSFHIQPLASSASAAAAGQAKHAALKR